MHLGNGAVTPGCAVVGFGFALAGLGVALLAIKRTGLDKATAYSAAALGAAVFAAQAVNVPVLPFSSAHLVGGVLLAWTLGPALGALTMAVVLALQALTLGDGGLMTLGVNIVNMGLLPAVLVTVLRRSSLDVTWPARRAAVAAGAAAIAVLAAALLIVAEVAFLRSPSQLNGIGAFAWQMTWTHAMIGLAEGMLTLGLLALLGQLDAPRPGALGLPRLLGTAAAALALIGALPYASRMPDGYEAAAAAAGMNHTFGALTGINQSVAHWQNTLVAWMPHSERLMVLAATVLTGLVVGGGVRLLARSHSGHTIMA